MTNGGGLMIDGATVSTVGALTNAGTATLQSGALSVGAVVNSGTLNLNGATLTRTPHAIFDNNLGTVNLSTGTLSLDGGDGRDPNAPQVPGGDYNLASGTRLEFTGGRYGVRSIVGEEATVTVAGVDSPAKLYSSSPMTISVQTLTVQAGCALREHRSSRPHARYPRRSVADRRKHRWRLCADPGRQCLHHDQQSDPGGRGRQQQLRRHRGSVWRLEHHRERPDQHGAGWRGVLRRMDVGHAARSRSAR